MLGAFHLWQDIEKYLHTGGCGSILTSFSKAGDENGKKVLCMSMLCVDKDIKAAV